MAAKAAAVTGRLFIAMQSERPLTLYYLTTGGADGPVLQLLPAYTPTRQVRGHLLSQVTSENHGREREEICRRVRHLLENGKVRVRDFTAGFLGERVNTYIPSMPGARLSNATQPHHFAMLQCIDIGISGRYWHTTKLSALEYPRSHQF